MGEGRWKDESWKEYTHASQMLESKLTVPSVMATCHPPSAVGVLTAIIVRTGAIRWQAHSRLVHLMEGENCAVVW